MKKAFYPYLLAIYPVFLIFSGNLNSLLPIEIFLPVLFVIILAFVIIIFSKIIFRDWNKAAIFSGVLIIIIENYMAAFDYLRSTPFNQLINGRQVIGFISVFFLICLTFYLLKKSKNNFRDVSRILNVFALIIVLFPLLQIFYHQIVYKPLDKERFNLPEIKDSGLPNNSEKPDIYYLIFNRYGSNETIESYGYDNSGFVKNLEKRGFHNISDNWSNYTNTGLSLASSLNMIYLDILGKGTSKYSNDEKVLFDLIENNLVVNSLKNEGYKYFHIGSWWGGTIKNKNADYNIKSEILFSELNQILFSRTIFYPLGVALNLHLFDGRYAQWLRVPSKFSEIEKIAKNKDATFVFAHFLIPHNPYVFDPEGNFNSEEENQKKSEEEKYVGQVKYLNKKIMEMVNKLLNEKGGQKPIIILQSDEGPYPEVYRRDSKNFDWTKASPLTIREKMGILTAVYFPDADYHDFNSVTSPVNLFRIIFNKYFSQNLEILPNKSFMSNKGRPYDFVKVIDKDKLSKKKE